MNYSFQREKILETVLNSCDHPNADTIYNRVRKIIPNISKGTVYRNLNFLSDNGYILKIRMSNGDRFDKTNYPHCHIKCIICNKVEDYNYINVDDLKIFDNKYKIMSVTVNLEGICENCLKERGNNNGIKGK